MEVIVFASIFCLSLVGLQLSLWIIFEHNQISGWKSLVPCYNFYLLQKITKVDSRNFWMWFIPVLNLYVLYLCNKNLCQRYRKNKEMIWGMTFFSWAFYPLFAIHVIDWMEKSIYDSFCGPRPLFGPAHLKCVESKKVA